MQINKRSGSGIATSSSALQKTSLSLSTVSQSIGSVGKGAKNTFHFLSKEINNEEYEREDKAPSLSIDPRKYLTQNERKAWDKLSDAKKKQITSKACNPSNVKSSGVKFMGSQTSKSTAVSSTKAVATTSAKVGTKAAVGAGTAGVGAVIVGGAEASKKVAETFRSYIERNVILDSKNKNEAFSGNGVAKVTPLLVLGGLVSSVITPTITSVIVAIKMMLLPIVVPIILIVALIIGAMTLFVSCASSMNSSTRSAFVEVAIREHETFLEADRGGRKYKDWFGMNDEWCAIFVSWVGNEVGLIEADVIPRTASVRVAANWFQERGQFVLIPRSQNDPIAHQMNLGRSYFPIPGDLAFFMRNGASHVSIVVDVNHANRTITTVGGNEGRSLAHVTSHHNSLVNRTTMSVYHPSLTGFAIPDFPMQASSEDVILLAGILEAEAYQVYEYYLAVGTIIMNRLENQNFPNTLREVIYQPGQFQPTWTGRLDMILERGPNSLAIQVAEDLLQGARHPKLQGYYFFLMASSTNRSGINIGGNLFFRRW